MQCNNDSVRSLKSQSQSGLGADYVVKNTIFLSRCHLRAVPSSMRAVIFNIKCGLQYPDVSFYSYGSKFGCNKKTIQMRRLEMEAMRFRKQQPQVTSLFISNAINPLKPELNPICYLLALLAHNFSTLAG